MFLLERLDFIALVGLFVQAFMAWVFVTVLASLRKRDPSRALDSFILAFACLATALTVLSVRFFRAHEIEQGGVWEDGHLAPTLCYALYQGLKGAFGLLLVRGCHALVGRDEPPLLRRAWWPTIGALAASAVVVRDITPLLIVQAPVMIACALAGWRALRSARLSLGIRLVRWSLFGLWSTWLLHAFAASGVSRIPSMHYVLSINSLVDLLVQLLLGTGLIVGSLQAAQRRARWAEHEREQLQRTVERDERLRSLGTLVSGVAHELNNPLTVILAHAEALAEHDPRARVLLEQAERCRGIVHSLSALAVQKPPLREDLDVRELFERVVRGLDPKLCEGREVRIGRIGARRLTADRIGLEQVLTNVVVNALHASPPGGVVTLDAEPASGERIELTVTDAGPGVPEALRTRLFEPFFTTKGPGHGTGLGLAIAHAIVGGHGGTISVGDGPENVGATLRIVLPREPAQSAPGSPHAAPPQEHAPDDGRWLLIVDDDDAVRAVLRMRAQRAGWNVSEAASAEDALSGARPIDAHDAVLCDLRMPGIGGIGLHDQLEREAPALLARFVFVTGDLASRQSAAFSRRCRRPLVCKPFDFAELLATLDEAAHTRPARAHVRS